uniref:glycosyltransferase n=1 Tax=Alistipes sp. TaxID=1872444 RepID=UPI0040573B12
MSKKLCVISTVEGTMTSFIIPAMKKFADQGDSVTIICSMGDVFQKRHGDTFHCINLPMNRGVSLKDLFIATWKFYRIFRQERFDYIQYTTPNAAFYASIASWLARAPIRVYCQWGIRYVGASGIMRKILKCIEHLTCTLSTHIRSASRKNLQFAVDEGLYPLSKANIIGDGGTIGIDFSQFDISKKDAYRDEILAHHPILKGKTVFCFVGRLQRDKGVVELLNAFFALNASYPNIALIIMGQKDGDLPKELLNKAEITPSIIFTGHTTEVVKYLAASDIMVHPSYREGFSMAIQQGMAMELPIVTTDIPGPSEVIEEGVSGLLASAKDTISLQHAMELLLNDEAMRFRMGECAYKRARELFMRERMLELTYNDRMDILNQK